MTLSVPIARSGLIAWRPLREALFSVFIVFFSVSRSGGLGAPWGGLGGSDLIAWRPLREMLFSVFTVFTVFNRLEAPWGVPFECFYCVFIVLSDLGSPRATRGFLMSPRAIKLRQISGNAVKTQ